MAKKKTPETVADLVFDDKNFTFIYGLICPLSNDVRYIGKSNNPKLRYSRHLSNAKHNDTHHAANWIRKLVVQNKKPILKVIERCNIKDWKERECFWINKYLVEGAELTNCKGGGIGSDFITEETRDKMRRAKIGNSIHKGFKNSEQSKLQMSTSAKEKFKRMPHLKIAIRKNQKKAAEKNRGLNIDQVRMAKFMFFYNLKLGQVAKETGLNYHVLCKIKQGENYTWVNL